MANIFPGFEVYFNTVAEAYDKMRPTYVRELYDDVFRYGDIARGDAALEVGIGTGQATRPMLDAGLDVTAVELGDNLAAFCVKKFGGYSNFSVVNADFREFTAPDNTYDLVYSASAFHWIPEETGYTKVFNMLKPGGIFARFANHPYKDKGNEALHQAIQACYAMYMPRSKRGDEYSREDAERIADIGRKYGFADITCRLYKRTRTFSAEEYTFLLGTYSDHIALPEDVRKKFYGGIRDAINSHGGSITIYDTIDLELYRKPRL